MMAKSEHGTRSLLKDMPEECIAEVPQGGFLALPWKQRDETL
jgi:hypothetical protein